MKPKIIVIVGPTASGKTSLSISLAQKLNGEIISADSRQIYRGLDIGTGKVTTEEMRGIPHHLIDIREPEELYSASQFKRDASEAITAICARGRVPIIAGGTFFYIEVLLERKSVSVVPPNAELRAQFELLETSELLSLLNERDPVRYAEIDHSNRRRIIRALEITEVLGQVPPSENRESPYDAFIIGIAMDKDELVTRIKVRLHERITNGMIREAKQLHADGLSFARMDELGLEYRYLAKFLSGEITKDEMTAQLETEIWHFAKRQRTWLRKMEGVRWYTKDESEKIEKDVRGFLEG